MSLVLLLDELAALRIELRLEDGRLRFKAPEGALTPQLRERMAAQKEDLLAHLSGRAPSEPETLVSAPSKAQERLWFFNQLQGPNITYNIPLSLRLRGRLDLPALHAALDDLVRRHQALRSAFRHSEGDLRLEIARELRAPWSELDLSALEETERQSRVKESSGEIARHCFDLQQAPLMRARLLKLAAEEHLLLLNFHHIVTDGWSFGIILQELAAGYEARKAGQAPSLPPLRWQYTDYIAWQQQLMRSGAMDADLAYWRESLAGAPACSTLPPDSRRPEIQDFTGDSIPFTIDAARLSGLRAKAREWGASLNHLTLAATVLFLAEASGQRDLVIGLPLANRTRRELEPLIGMFVNVVPLRISLAPDEGIEEIVARIKRASTEAMEHCHLPFERLVEELASARELSMTPLFQVAYNYLPPLQSRLSFGGLEVELPNLEGGITVSKYDCTFYLDEHEGSISGHIEYAAGLYRRETVLRWARSYIEILDTMLAGAEAARGRLSGIGLQERGRLEAWCTGPVVPLPAGSPWSRFATVARDRPGEVALEEGETRMSYAALERRAEIISALLARQGIGKGSRVGLLLPRGGDYVAAMLGVARCGAVFVPFDQAQPAARLAKMAAQARLGAVVCHPGAAAAATLSPVNVELSTATWDETLAIPEAAQVDHEDPLYIIFTSGSTGTPKAVLVPWRGLCNIVQSYSLSLSLTPGERFSQIASIGFDASLFELWPALLSGGTLVFVPEDRKLDPEALRDWLLRSAIAVHFSPTPLAEALLELAWPAHTPLRLLATGGQTLHARPRPGLPFRVSNNYGPTEASIASTSGLVEAGEKDGSQPTIGRAIDNTRLAVLDGEGRRVPLGTVGELYISGLGVALEYFGDPEATARSFVTLPAEPHCRWYRTGDNVRLLPGGDWDFVGRLDGQIKLRGHRIEIGEIESALLRIPGVRHAAVRLEGEQLAAYLEADAGAVSREQVRGQISAVLPSYMVPAHLILLDQLPRQSSGKIDIKSLPFFHQEISSASANPAAPREGSALETAIGKAWAKVLKLHAPGVNDNFFDLGGHSLMLLRLKEQIKLETGRDLSVLDLFRNPTIARQAASLEGGQAAKPKPLGTAPRPVSTGGIAIIGMAGRFPDADNVEAFWKNLREGRDSITRFTREELLAAGVPAELADSPDYVPANAILRGVERFDADFFGVPAREAEIMDPQQRLLLEEAWHAFEDAGYDPARITGRVGVFVGSSLNAYLIENVLPRRDIMDDFGGFAVLISNDKDFSATRLSYKLDLRGPSVSVNTACSTSLVAIHQAVTALRDGQCELALAGGSCVRSRQIDGYRYEEGGVLSRDGTCRAFDASATGMVGGNGVALVLLKPLESALADQDPIYAVIKGIAVNNDGSDKVGFTAPGVRGQSLVIRDALERAGVDPQTVLYAEAHGTATQLGDTIEVAALAENYAPEDVRQTPLLLGSVKTNIGHLDAAAGATGLIKTALCLHERTLVPSLHFQKPNPQIHWPGESFSVSTQTRPWEGIGQPLRAAVSSLGIGGTNAHAVLEEAPARAPAAASPPGAPALLLLSGRGEASLQANASALAAWLGRHPEARLADVAHTLAFGRRHRESRRAICASGPIEAAEALAEPLPLADKAEGVAFLFTGMGTHKPGMGRALYEHAPVFKACIDACSDLLQPHLGLDIRSLLLAKPDDTAASTLLNEHRVGQPCVFSLEYALATFWIELGLSPSVLIGHSLGEWVAACVAGVFTLPDALRLVSLRGGLMDRQSKGSMLAVNLTEPEVASRLPAGLDIATVNALDQIVVAGPEAAVEAFAKQLEAENIRCKRLQVTLAAHSSLMEPALAQLRAAIEATPRHTPRAGLAIVSNITGQYLEPLRLQSPDYWTEHLRRCVRFADGLGTLWAQPRLALLECGPSHTLCNLALQDNRRTDARAILASLDGDDNAGADWCRLLASAGALWASGLPVDLAKLFALQGAGRRIPLPGYVFQRKRYWLDAVHTHDAAPHRTTAPTPVAETDEAAPSAPSNASPVERRVIALMRQLLGPVHLGRNSNFFLSGGDSLLALRLGALIGSSFRKTLARSQLMQATTPAAIAALLEADAPGGEAPIGKTDGCLMRLRSGDDRLPPIVLVHAVGGGAFIYGELLQAMDTAHPVYGLQAPGLWDDSPPLADLRKQAEHYHACLLRAGIQRPLMLAGSSYGGLVCYELDRLYQLSGHKTALVALLDSPGPGHMPDHLDSEAEVCAYLLAQGNTAMDYPASLRQVRALDPAGRSALLQEWMRTHLMPGATPEDAERLVRVIRQNLANMWDWIPQPHDARLLFFKAVEKAALVAHHPELAWIPLASGGIEILPAPGNHASMLSPPHVTFLAKELNRRLSAAASSP